MSKSFELRSRAEVAHNESFEINNITSTTQDKIHSEDVGAKYAGAAEDAEYTISEKRKYLRRVDMVIMPLLFITWGLQYADKSILSSASQFGIVQDLGLATVQVIDGEKVANLQRFSYATMLFYWGYFVGVLPATYLAQRMPLGKFVGISVVVWGIVTMSTAGVKSYPGLMVNRFFLGICESTPAPAFSLITPMWYTRDEQPLRIAIWYSASGIGSLLAGIAFYGIGHIHSSLHPWKYQYLILGAITVVWGCVVAYFLPDNPMNARFLKEEERVLAVKRLRDSQTGIENTVFKPYQVKEALLDPKTWLLVITAFTITLVNGAVSGFGAIVIRSFGFSGFDAVLLSGSAGGVIFVFLILFGTLVLYYRNQRINVFVFTTLLVISGCIMVWKSSWKNLGVPLAGFYLLVFFAVAYVMLLSLMTANTAGHTKKATTSGLVWATTVIANAVGPLLVKTTEAAKHYPSLVEPLLAVLALSIAMMVALRVYLTMLNRARDAEGTVTEEDLTRTAFADMTDRENPNFRYTW